MEPRSPLAIPDYRLFWISRFTAVLATMSMVIVLAWQVYDVARTDYGMSTREAAFQLGLLGLAQFVPLLVMTPVAGWAADRFERRTVARLADAVDLAICLALGAATWAGILTLPLLFSLAAAHGVARVFIGPAMNAIAPNIVPAHLLPKAIAMNSIAWQSASVIGPAAGGLLYAIDGPLAYWCAAATLLVPIAALSLIRPVHPPAMDRRIHPVRQMIDGLRYTWRDRFLLGAITLDLFAVLLAGATALLPVFARDILQVGPAGLGQLRAAPAFGSVLVAIGLSVWPLANNVGVKMLWAVVVFGLATIGFGLCGYLLPLGGIDAPGSGGMTSWAMLYALAMLAVLGAADMFSVFIRNSLVQLNVPDTMRGRVGSVSGLAISASNELGEMQSGIAAAMFGPVGAVVFGGAGAILITGIWARLFPELRNARTFEARYKDAPS
jgi:MFS family permease